jgi:hypothetical protein
MPSPVGPPEQHGPAARRRVERAAEEVDRIQAARLQVDTVPAPDSGKASGTTVTQEPRDTDAQSAPTMRGSRSRSRSRRCRCRCGMKGWPGQCCRWLRRPAPPGGPDQRPLAGNWLIAAHRRTSQTVADCSSATAARAGVSARAGPDEGAQAVPSPPKRRPSPISHALGHGAASRCGTGGVGAGQGAQFGGHLRPSA